MWGLLTIYERLNMCRDDPPKALTYWFAVLFFIGLFVGILEQIIRWFEEEE